VALGRLTLPAVHEPKNVAQKLCTHAELETQETIKEVFTVYQPSTLLPSTNLSQTWSDLVKRKFSNPEKSQPTNLSIKPTLPRRLSPFRGLTRFPIWLFPAIPAIKLIDISGRIV